MIKEKLDFDALMEAVLAAAKDESQRETYITVYKAMIDEYMPVIELLRDTVGTDLDKFVDDMIKWGARKAFVSYNAYRTAGFSKKEAMQLTLNAREDLANALRHVKTG